MSQSAEASIFYAVESVEGGFDIRMDGGVGYDQLQVSFSEMHFNADECGGLPQGVFRIRDDTGYWYKMTLDDCTGCAEVSWRGEIQGDMCVGEVLQSAATELFSDFVQ